MAKNNSKYSGRKLKKPDMSIEKNYTQFPNAFILNPEIGNSELRLLLFLMMNKNNYVIQTENCVKYLHKSKQAISPQFAKLIKLGVVKITDENIEVIIPEEMKKYKWKYLDGIIRQDDEVKKTSPQDSTKPTSISQDDFTIEVKKTSPSKKENLTSESSELNTKNAEDVDVEVLDDDLLLSNNNRVLPVPAKGGGTEQTHSNKTIEDWGVGVLEGVDEALASPSVLAPSSHPPKSNEEIFLTTKLDKRFTDQLNEYNASKYFLTKNFRMVKDLYNQYVIQHPNEFIPIYDFEEILVCLITLSIGMCKRKGINVCLIYRHNIIHNFKDIPELRQEMADNPTVVKKILKDSEL